MKSSTRLSAVESSRRTNTRVVCVDLDGTLVVGDLLLEAFVALFKRSPIRALFSLIKLRNGKASFKREIAKQIQIDPAALTYREDLIAQLSELRDQGATLVLATASDLSYARAVAEHLGMFAEVIASNGLTNLSGTSKAKALLQRYGQFEYIGNGWADVPVWRSAAVATAVAAPVSLARYGRLDNFIHHVRSVQPNRLTTILKALRPHQWVKNFLVFVPIIAAHTLFQSRALLPAALAFTVFSLSASGIYLLNDISDIQPDRAHPRKRRRPFAAGDLTIPFGVTLAVVLLTAAVTLAFAAMSTSVALLIIAYVITTSAYSLRLKQIPVADVFTLTGLYILRIVAGGLATATPLSSWLLAFALFVFLSLAFIKRFTELLKTQGWSHGRGYRRDDAAWMQAVGTGAGYMAVLVLALYVNAPETSALYARARVLWLLCPLLLYWLTRLWFRAGRAMLLDDPVLDALKDPATYVGVAAAIGILLAAL